VLISALGPTLQHWNHENYTLSLRWQTHTWSLMNRFRAGQGPCRANLHKRGLAQSPSCDCGHEPHCRHVPVNKTWSTKRMMTQSCGCNLQRLQHARNNSRHILCVISREKPGRPYERTVCTACRLSATNVTISGPVWAPGRNAPLIRFLPRDAMHPRY